MTSHYLERPLRSEAEALADMLVDPNFRDRPAEQRDWLLARAAELAAEAAKSPQERHSRSHGGRGDFTVNLPLAA